MKISSGNSTTYLSEARGKLNEPQWIEVNAKRTGRAKIERSGLRSVVIEVLCAKNVVRRTCRYPWSGSAGTHSLHAPKSIANERVRGGTQRADEKEGKR